MAINHADCTHPRTPAGRAACRRLAALKETPGVRRARELREGRRRATLSDASPTGRIRHHEPPPPQGVPGPTGQLKRPGTHLRTIGDLPDVPRMLAHGCRIAWKHGWDVVVGHQFNDYEKRIVVTGDVAEVALVWKPSLPHGVWGVFVRKHGHPITHRVEAGVDHAMRLAAGSESWAWDE
jgi:hypothetical protein